MAGGDNVDDDGARVAEMKPPKARGRKAPKSSAAGLHGNERYVLNERTHSLVLVG